jgi:glutathione S-transferase
MSPPLILFYSPRACSLACHIALEETGLPFEASPVRIRADEHRSEAYLRVNPKGKIPALRVGEEVLTETHAILTYIAGLAPQACLLPPEGALARARAHEWLNYLSSTVHIAFRPLFRPASLIDDPSLAPRLRAFGAPVLRDILAGVDRRLEGRRWALGEAYSVCDPYLLVFYIWSQREDVVGDMADMPRYRALAHAGACWPAGMPRWLTRVWPIQFMQYPTVIVAVQGLFNSTRQIYLDGRGHANPDLIEQTYNGDSVARFEGDTLVIDSTDFQPKHHWIMQGVPTSDQLHIVERITMAKDGQSFTDAIIMTDPVNWQGEWKNTKLFVRVKGEDVVESHCLPDLNDHILATHAEHNER